jgi:rubrerythrin
MALLTGNEIIDMAVRLEEKGQAFYNAAAERADSAEVQSLFAELAVQEQYHRRAFEQMGGGAVALSMADEQWEQFQAYRDALLQNTFFADAEGALKRAKEARDEGEALQAALDFEKETLGFYQDLRDVVRGADRQTIERIANEEKEHIRRLSAMLATLPA